MDYHLPPYFVQAVFKESAGQVIDWGVQLLNVPVLWDQTRGAGARVALLDTGVDATHPDLAGALEGTQDFTGSTSGGADRVGHGTHCSGIVAARDNQTGCVGVAPETTLLMGKVLGDSGGGTSQGIASGIRWAIAAGADVISMSLGSPQPDPVMEQAVMAALNAGILVVAAAGNDGSRGNVDTINWPARYAGVLSVGSINRQLAPSTFSSRGDRLDVMAPGDQITSLWPGGGLAVLSGTSMATPFIAGVLALLVANQKKHGLPRLTPAKAIEFVHNTCRDLLAPGKDRDTGYGVVDPAKLIAATQPPAPPVPTPPPPPVPPLPGPGHTIIDVVGALTGITINGTQVWPHA